MFSKARHLTILSIFLPTLFYGQSKDCNTVYTHAPVLPFYLTAIKKVNDTIISYIPKNCNLITFDSITSGHWKIYSDDTITVMEIVTIKKGLRNGKSFMFYKNRQIESYAEYKDSKLNGEYISYYENGKVHRTGRYKIDKSGYEVFTGTISEYWDNGNIAHMKHQKDSSYYDKNEKYWDKEGNIIDRESFRKLWYECK